jgi:hypothetical protein
MASREQGAVGAGRRLGTSLDVCEAEPPVVKPVDSCLHGAELGECGMT